MGVGRRQGLATVLAVGLAGAPAALAQVPTTADPLVIPDLDAVPPEFANGVIIDQSTHVECGGQAVTALRAEALPPGLAYPPVSRQTGPVAAYRLAFSIAGDGRPHSVRPEPLPEAEPGQRSEGTHIAQASLLGWRFAPQARADCHLTVQPSLIEIGQASEALKARAMAISSTRVPWRPALLRALERPGDDCRRRPAYRSLSNGRQAIQPLPGTRAWAAWRFDVDARGRVQALEVIESSPDPDLVAALGDALRETEYHPGPARKGCILALNRFGDQPPPGPVELPDVTSLNRCTPAQRARFTTGPLRYPEAFLERGIEGWALVRFDLSSWGRVGGVELIQAEPAAAFGDQAVSIIKQGRVTPTFDNAVDCVDRVIFRLADADRTTTDVD